MLLYLQILTQVVVFDIKRVEIGLFIFLTFEPINYTIYTENHDTLLLNDPPTKLKDNPT